MAVTGTPAPVIEIFRVGRHTAMNGETLEFAAADLAATVAAYDPALHQAPAVVGHPKTDDPAYGWVSSVAVGSDGRMTAALEQVDPQFAEAVAAGRYKRVSVKFWSPTAAGNPKPGVYYLRHVGFLGAAAPAVKGLRPVQFADGDDAEAVEFSAPITLATPAQEPAVADPTPTPDAAALAARERELAEREAAFAEREARAEAERTVAALVAEGKVLPRDQSFVAAFMASLDEAGVVEFAEGDATVKKPSREAFATFLSGLPRIVEFAEVAPPESTAAETVEFAAPDRLAVDQGDLAVHARALEYQRANPGTDYLTAVKAAGRK